MASSRIAIGATRLPLHLQRCGVATPSFAAAVARPGVVRPLSSASSSSFVPKNSLNCVDRAGRRRRGSGTTFTIAGGHNDRQQQCQLPSAQPALQQQQAADFHTSGMASFHTQDHADGRKAGSEPQPGSVAFGECEISALSDLFLQFAKSCDDTEAGPYLNKGRIKLLLESVGEKPDDDTLANLMKEVDVYGDGKLRLDCFLRAADKLLGEAPARIVLVVGGPGSGKGALCARLAKDCGAVHLSCGEMLREEVEADTPLGREVAEIMAMGDLVSSALVTALMRRRMRQHPGRRILLDGFPRSLENARDFVELCGPPELALHLDCDDTVLIERILARGGKSAREAELAAAEGRGDEVNVRGDDNVHTAIQRLKNYHKHHHKTMSWLKEIRVPIVELDCSGSKDDVWRQLEAIGRLMRPAVKLPHQSVVQQPPPQQTHHHASEMNGESRVNEDMQWIA